MYKRIKDLRKNKSLSQKHLADTLNVSQSTYSRYENGQLEVPSDVLISLSRFYDVSVDYILGLKD